MDPLFGSNRDDSGKISTGNKITASSSKKVPTNLVNFVFQSLWVSQEVVIQLPAASGTNGAAAKVEAEVTVELVTWMMTGGMVRLMSRNGNSKPNEIVKSMVETLSH